MKVFKKNLPSTDIFLVCLLVLVAFGVYANTLKNEFVWDDTTLFITNYDRWQWKNLKELLTTHDNLFREQNTGYYRPLVNLTYLVDRQLWGSQPFGYHLTNILFHVLSTLVVFFTARALLRTSTLGLITALLFAVHPVHTETVAWINGRNNALSGLFYFSAFFLYIRYSHQPKTKTLLFSLVLFLCSLLSKEYALTFPILLLLYEISYHREASSLKKRFVKKAPVWLPYICVMVGYLLIRFLVLRTHNAVDLQPETVWFRVLTVPKTIIIYLRLLAFPVNLTPFYDVSLITHPFKTAFVFQLMTLVALLGLWGWSFKKSRTVFFAIGWILITLIPVLNIIPVSYPESFISEHYLYIPAFGFCVLAAWGCGRLWRFATLSSSRSWRYAALFFFMLIIEVSGFETVKRNLVWRNELTLWQDTVQKSPRNFRVRCNLSIALHDSGQLDEALKEINEALRLNSQNDTPYFIRGVILYDLGKLSQSLDALKKTLHLNPHHADASDLIRKIQHRLRRRTIN